MLNPITLQQQIQGALRPLSVAIEQSFSRLFPLQTKRDKEVLAAIKADFEKNVGKCWDAFVKKCLPLVKKHEEDLAWNEISFYEAITEEAKTTISEVEENKVIETLKIENNENKIKKEKELHEVLSKEDA